MRDLNEDNFDAMLREHLSGELDSQVGRARAAFTHHTRRTPWRMTAYAGLAVAATIAGLLLLRPAAPPPANEPAQVATAESAPIEYESTWRTIDRGTVFLDEGTPMRKFVRQYVESLRWVDPQTQETMELTVPREEILLVPLVSI